MRIKYWISEYIRCRYFCSSIFYFLTIGIGFSQLADEYIISPGDVIYIDALNAEEVTGTYSVGPDGKKTLPIAGVVHLSGLTRQEASEVISEALSPHFRTKVAVSVRIDEYKGNRYYVWGDVVKPGVYSFDYSPTLLDMIYSVGGVSFPQMKPSGQQAPKSYPVYCTIVRRENKLPRINLSELLFEHDLTLNVQLQQNDVIHVQRIRTEPLYVMGEVQAPGYYNLSPNMTLLDAIFQAGGFTRDGAMRRIHVVHMNSFTHEQINFKDLMGPDPNLDVLLESGDIVYVPTKYLAKFNYFWSQIIPFRSIPTLGL